MKLLSISKYDITIKILQKNIKNVYWPRFIHIEYTLLLSHLELNLWVTKRSVLYWQQNFIIQQPIKWNPDTLRLLVIVFVVNARLLVLLVLGYKIVHVGLRLGELHLVHALAGVPVEEGL